VNFAYKYLFSHLKGSLKSRKILRNGADGFTSPPKGGSEPANRGFNGKYDNRYTNEKVWHYV
jgi:hypothetical protein